MVPINKVSQSISVGLLCLLVVACTAVRLQAQNNAAPQREQLLNGLRVLIWPRSGDSEVLLKLRIHSGAAFDLANKSGEITLLGDLLFPDPATREYFTEEMQGRLEVITDFDSLTVVMKGKASEFEKIIEILRNAVVATQLTPETVANVRDARIKIVKDTSISPATIADRAIAARLFGDFPYGKLHTGSVESLGRVERADLMLARERFLNPNNATLAIWGGVQPTRVLRTLRQLLGSWRKSEHIVPATFRQPLPPDPRTLIIRTASEQSSEIRLAVRGLARSDRDAAAASLLASVARQRWEKLEPELARNPMFVRHDARILPGIFVMGTTASNALVPKTLSAAREVLKSFAANPVTAAELEHARTEALAQITKGLADPDGVTNAWLDVDTYKLEPVTDQLTVWQKASAADLQRAATRLFSNPVASVAIGNSDALKALLAPEQIELLGDLKPSSPAASAPATNVKPD